MAGVKIYLLGSPRLELDDKPLTFDTSKIMALVAYLAITGRHHSREALATLLWPESDPSHARAGLRRNLSMLNKALAGHWLVIERESIGSDPKTDYYLDVDHFRELLASLEEHGHSSSELCSRCFEPLEKAIALYQGDFLAGFSLRDSRDFDEWQFFQSEELRRELAAALLRLVYGLEEQRAYEPAIKYARRWLALNPLHEPAHQYLMQLYARSGQQAAALRQYEECKRILQEELKLEPDASTHQLLAAVKGRQDLPRLGDLVAGVTRSDILNNRYRLDNEIGRSSHAIVYQGHDLLLDRDIAVKVYAAAGLDDAGRKQILHEARTAAGLNHPNIVSIYDAGESGRRSYIVSELIVGQPLNTQQPMLLEVLLTLTRQICDALAHAHQQSIIHRNLKPENIILVAGGAPKLTDFGLARPVPLINSKKIAIPPRLRYVAPELKAGKSYDARADIYSLGVILYELVSGKIVSLEKEAVAADARQLYSLQHSHYGTQDGIPPKLTALICRMVDENPAKRPASAEDVLQLLDDCRILDA